MSVGNGLHTSQTCTVRKPESEHSCVHILYTAQGTHKPCNNNILDAISNGRHYVHTSQTCTDRKPKSEHSCVCILYTAQGTHKPCNNKILNAISNGRHYVHTSQICTDRKHESEHSCVPILHTLLKALTSHAIITFWMLSPMEGTMSICTHILCIVDRRARVTHG